MTTAEDLHGQKRTIHKAIEDEANGDSQKLTRIRVSSPDRGTKRNIRRCFRILDIPVGWSEDTILTGLKEVLNLDLGEEERLKLFPAINDSNRQVGILALFRTKEPEGLAPMNPDDPKATIRVGGTYLTIDRLFYGLTPLNSPTETPVLE